MSFQNIITFGLFILSAIAVWYYSNKKKPNMQHLDASSIVEPFLPSLTYKVDKVYDAGNSTMLSVPGTFQSMVPPRFGMLDGAVVSVPTIDGSNNPGVSPTYGNLDVNSMAFDPSAPLQQGIVGNNGEYIQPVVYDRLIYANRRSRLLEGSDFIRGDLPIRPQNLGWFSPSVQPHIDLRKGFVDNYEQSTADNLSLLQMESQGKFAKAFEGEMTLPNTLVPTYDTYINSSVGDVQVANFS